MIYIAFIFLIYCFFKEFYYGLFEIHSKQNKKAGFFIIFLSFLGFILPSITIILNYQ